MEFVPHPLHAALLREPDTAAPAGGFDGDAFCDPIGADMRASSTPKPDVQQIIYALERVERSLLAQAEAMGMDYDAEFPAEDAARMREAIELLLPAAAKAPPTPGDNARAHADRICNRAAEAQPVVWTDEQAYHMGRGAYECSVLPADQGRDVKAFWQLTTIQQAGWVAKAAMLASAPAAPASASLAEDFREYLYRVVSQVPLEHAEWAQQRGAALLAALKAEPQQPAPQPRLTVRLCSFPESNGKRNWTALLVRVDAWGGLVGNCGGITIDRGECWNRVAYEAERAKLLIGERDTEPHILDYGDDIRTPEEWEGEVRGGRPVRPGA